MNKGFSLVEMLIAMALMAMSMAMVVLIIATVYKNSRKSTAVGTVMTEGSAALRVIDTLTRYATNLDCTSQQLTVTGVDGKVAKFYIDATESQVASQSVAMSTTYYLTTKDTVASLCTSGVTGFCQAGTNNKYVDICFVLQNTEVLSGDKSTTAGDTGKEFKAKITLRNWGV